jgi:hypothetical protein
MSSKYSTTKSKTGSTYYYKVSADGKKTRVSKADVPVSFRKTPDEKTAAKKQKKEVSVKQNFSKLSEPKIQSVTQKKTIKAVPKLKIVRKEKKVVEESPKKIVKKTVKKNPKPKTVENPKKMLKAAPPKIIVCQFGRGVAYPKKEGFKNYPIHSKGAKPWKELSPFFIGPVDFINSKGQIDSCPIFENYWQGSKVWKNVTKQNQKKPEWTWPSETHIGKDGEPNNAWRKWHDALLAHEKAVRRPNGKAIPEYALWFNKESGEYEKLDTIEARKKIYIPVLKELYRKHPVYQKMLKEFRGGQNMILIEPDGAWAVAYPEGREVTLEILESLVEKMNYAEEGYPKQYQPFGHGYVAAMCLLEDY